MTDRRPTPDAPSSSAAEPPRPWGIGQPRTVVALGAGLVVALLWLAYFITDPTPPREIVIAAGVDGSVYERFAEQYRAILARNHVRIEIRRSAGSMQNLHDLGTQIEGADVAFIQSGTSNDSAAMRRRLVSLGSLFVEPVWIFYREAAVTGDPPGGSSASAAGGDHAIRRLDQLRGMKLNVGPGGSGGPRLARQLLSINEIGADDVELSDFDDATAEARLLDGSLDAVMLVTAPESPIVQTLLQSPGIRLVNLEQAEAYSRRFPFLKHVVLPQGIVSFDKGIPEEDIQLIAPTATLVARDDLHPAAIELLVQAAATVHGGTSWFGHAGEFPNDQYTEIPVSSVAERYYREGPLFLQRYLPFWLANFIERLGLVVVPLIALAIPLSRLMPPLYAWHMRSRIYRWYADLRRIEEDADRPRADRDADVPAHDDAAATTSALARLASIQTKVDRLAVPLAFANEQYALKVHIESVRQRLVSARGDDASSGRDA